MSWQAWPLVGGRSKQHPPPPHCHGTSTCHLESCGRNAKFKLFNFLITGDRIQIYFFKKIKHKKKSYKTFVRVWKIARATRHDERSNWLIFFWQILLLETWRGPARAWCSSAAAWPWFGQPPRSPYFVAADSTSTAPGITWIYIVHSDNSPPPSFEIQFFSPTNKFAAGGGVQGAGGSNFFLSL